MTSLLIFILVLTGITAMANSSQIDDTLYSLVSNQNQESPKSDFYSGLYPSEYSNELSSNEVDNTESSLISLKKKSAPRRIFIGKRTLSSLFSNPEEEESAEYLTSFNHDKKNPRRHLFLGKRSLNANGKRHIQRIFIGKRGDIKRIFIG